jgi:hypothetical protein
MGSRFDPMQLSAPQRSKTQMLLLSAAISILAVEPRLLPLGRFRKVLVTEYSVLGVLLGSLVWLRTLNELNSKQVNNTRRFRDRFIVQSAFGFNIVQI